MTETAPGPNLLREAIRELAACLPKIDGSAELDATPVEALREIVADLRAGRRVIAMTAGETEAARLAAAITAWIGEMVIVDPEAATPTVACHRCFSWWVLRHDLPGCSLRALVLQLRARGFACDRRLDRSTGFPKRYRAIKGLRLLPPPPAPKSASVGQRVSP